jgi:hypothetical protein
MVEQELVKEMAITLLQTIMTVQIQDSSVTTTLEQIDIATKKNQ